MKNKKMLIVVATVLLVGVIGVVGFTFARYQSTATATPAPKVAKWKVSVGGQDISDGTTKSFDANIKWEENPNIYENGQTVIAPGSKGDISFDINATGSQVAVKYNIKLDTSKLKDHKQIKITKIISTQDGKETIINETEEFNGTINLADVDKPVTIKVYIEWDPLINNENDTEMGSNALPLSIGVSVTASQKINDTLAEAIIKNATELGDNVADRTKLSEPETKPGEAGSSSTERVLASTSDDYGTSYYFRGNVQDNFVNFANKCWRIVRIQGDNSVKLILEDKNNLCENANGGQNTTVEGAGSKGGDNAFIGSANYGYKSGEVSSYMFDYTESTSGAKQKIDDWISHDITIDDQSKLKTENWCLGNQTDWYDFTTGQSSTNYSYSVYSETYKRLNGLGSTQISVTLKCNGSHDEKVSDIGGLLTADEVTLAGYKFGTYVHSSYLYVYNHNWWLATPEHRHFSTDYAFYVFGAGANYGYNVNEALAVRPAVVLQSSVEITGGDGTQQNPYRV